MSSNLYESLSYDTPIEKVVGVLFSVNSNESVENKSTVEITNTSTYSGSQPSPNGLFDSRLGASKGEVCTVCNQNYSLCTGHSGHITLAKPVFNMLFGEIIKKILLCVCIKCSKLLVDRNNEFVKNIISKRISNLKKFTMLYEYINNQTRGKKCGLYCENGCGFPKPVKISKNQLGYYEIKYAEMEDKLEDTKFYAEDVLRIFYRITDDDCEAMGFSPKFNNRPENMIHCTFSVPSVMIRPSMIDTIGRRSVDDLTHKICDIIKSNNDLRKAIETNKPIRRIEDHIQSLQWDCITFQNNETNRVTPAIQRTGRKLRTIVERIKGKQGRIRGNLMGKRVDFSSRSVITPDPNIDINEYGIPYKVAMNLTIPEKVNKYNIERLRQAVANGNNKYVGAKYVRKRNNIHEKKVIRNGIDFEEKHGKLEYGDIVDRHIMNGDFGLVNRQPSLHKMSMMAHKLRVMDHNTFRLNVEVTPPYNGDFDGDEQNLIIAQSIQSATELEMIANVERNIISPRESKPIISVVQDITLGIYRITLDDVEITQKQLFNLMVQNSMFNSIKDINKRFGKDTQVKTWSGREVLSTIIPQNVNTRFKNDDVDVEIMNGKIVKGTFVKGVYQNRSNGLVHITYHDNSPKMAQQLFDNTQRLICNWLVYSGFSVGVSDLLIGQYLKEELNEILQVAKKDVYKFLRHVHQGHLDNKKHKDTKIVVIEKGGKEKPIAVYNNSFLNNKEYAEHVILDILNTANEKMKSNAYKEINSQGNNRMINMVTSGAKGKKDNITQMVAALAQQIIEGKRVSDSYNDRTLPHFCKYDDGTESRGFVENSFIDGLTPNEFYCASAAGRIGLIDTAVRTSDTGYVQRKLIKGMEDNKINHDFTVRNANGNIIQFLYGEDGMDSIKLENQRLTFIEKTPAELEDEYMLRVDDCLKNLFDKTTYKKVIGEAEKWQEEVFEHFKFIMTERTYMIRDVFKGNMEDKILYPIAFDRFINDAKNLFHKEGKVNMQCDLDPSYILNKIDALAGELHFNESGNRLLKLLLNINLSPKKIILHHRFNSTSFEYICARIKTEFMKAIAHPREMVGVVAAQSIGEPCTQLVLNSVVWDTPILLDINGKLTKYTIGEYIDAGIEKADKSKLEFHPNDTTLAYLPDEDMVRIMAPTEDGKMIWDRVLAITRHPVINEDGSNKLLKMTTKSGRTITATKAKGFLKRVNNKIVGVTGDELKVGDYLPISALEIRFSQLTGEPELSRSPNWKDYKIDKNLYNEIFDGIDIKDEFIELINTNKLIIPDVVLSIGTFHINFNEIDYYILKTTNNNDLKILNKLKEDYSNEFGEVWYDEIVKIEEVENPYDYVYDFTTEKTRNFTDATGMCLRDSFHSSGTLTATKSISGVPRVKELLSVSKNLKAPTSDVYLVDEVKFDEKKSKQVMDSIKTSYLSEILVKSAIYFDPKDTDTQIEDDAEFMRIYKQFESVNTECVNNSPWLLRLEIDADKLLDIGMSMLDIYHAIIRNYSNATEEKLECYFSDENSNKLVFRIRIKNDENIQDVISELKAIEHILTHKKALKGITNINNAIMKEKKTFTYFANTDKKLEKFEEKARIYNPEDKNFEEKKEWVINTDGNNLEELLAHPMIDSVRTISNDVHEILHTLGIEAAKKVLLNEFYKVFNDIGINYRHISLLVDSMTHKGKFINIDRHGINKSDISPLAKASFEESADMLIKSAMFSEYDRMTGVSANVMFGQVPPAGTGDVDLMVDFDKLEDINEPEEEIFGDAEELDEDCKLDFGFNAQDAFNMSSSFDMNMKNLIISTK